MDDTMTESEINNAMTEAEVSESEASETFEESNEIRNDDSRHLKIYQAVKNYRSLQIAELLRNRGLLEKYNEDFKDINPNTKDDKSKADKLIDEILAKEFQML